MHVELRNQWREIIRSGLMGDIIEQSMKEIDPRFTIHGIPDFNPHIQSENNGGLRALNQLTSILINLPFEKEDEQEPVSIEYI